MSSFSNTADRLVGWLGWVVRVVSLLILPGMLYAMFRVIVDVAGSDSARLWPFLIASAVTAGALYLLVQQRKISSAVMTFEHELTHALFAWLTLHRVDGLSAALRSGSHVRYEGRGNWLIATAPLFVPLGVVLALVVAELVGDAYLGITSALLGVAVGYFVVANWSPRFRHYGDTREAGLLLKFAFLPVANAFVAGLVLSYVGGLRPVSGFLHHIAEPTRFVVRLIMSL